MLFIRAISISVLVISAVVALPIDGAVASTDISKSLPDILLNAVAVTEPESHETNPNVADVISVLSEASTQALGLIGRPVQDILSYEGDVLTSEQVAGILLEVLEESQKVFFTNPRPATRSKALPNLLSTVFVNLEKVKIYRALKPQLTDRFIYDWEHIGQNDVATLLRKGKLR
ncbi:hypothetical protein H0H93_014409 [Arthromyces matolae]|nr:hypothetical protein H0H93_014409 [Arthromyces matolae]